MFERFTEPARQVVVVAQDEARGLGHSYLGTEHLLLGLIREDRGAAAPVLAAASVTEEAVRARLSRLEIRHDALVTVADSTATRILSEIGADAGSIRDELLLMIGSL